MATNNKLIYSYSHGTQAIAPEILSSYSDSLIFDEAKRTVWYRGHQYGNSYYMSSYGENFNDFINNDASGDYSHAEGSYTSASGKYSHASGLATKASGDAALSSGSYTVASGLASHAEGEYSTSTGEGSHAEGYNSLADGKSSHAEGHFTTSEGEGSHAEGNETISSGAYSHAEGRITSANGESSHAEGQYTTTYGISSHAEGQFTESYGLVSHAEGQFSKSYGQASHAEGYMSLSYGDSSHAEGKFTYASGESSHAEGIHSYSEGEGSHAEGISTYASGVGAHSSGIASYAIGTGSFVSGIGTQAYNPGEVAIGSYNASYEGKTLFTIGDGTSYEQRHNIFEVRDDATYTASKSFYGDQVIGPVTYSYIDFLGPDVTLQELLLSSVHHHEPDYTRPVIYTKFTADGQDITEYQASYINSEEAVTYLTMQVGTSFRPGVRFFWPSTENVQGLGTRSSYDPIDDYLAVNPTFLGYSYGLAEVVHPLQYDYAWAHDSDYDYPTPNATTYGSNISGDVTQSSGYTYLRSVNDYLVIDNIQLSYKNSSYQVIPGLWEQGQIVFAYGHGDNSYFGAATAYVPQKLWIRSRYLWYAGTSESIPQTFDDILYNSTRLKKAFLNEDPSTIKNELLYDVTKPDSKASVFFIAIPSTYSLASDDEGYVKVVQKDGLEFGLVTDIQKMQTRTLLIPSGSTQVLYKLYYIVFKQSPLGIYGSYIQAAAIGGASPEQNGYLATEWGWPLGTENGDYIKFDVWGESPVPPEPIHYALDESGNIMTDESGNNNLNFDVIDE